MKLRNVAASAVTGLALAVTAGPVLASDTAVAPGAFCKQDEAGQVQPSPDYEWYRCALRGGTRYRWYPIADPSGAAPHSTVTLLPTQAYTLEPAPSSSAATTATDQQLPVTGSNGKALVIAAGVLLAAGVGVVVVARRRRTRFEA